MESKGFPKGPAIGWIVIVKVMVLRYPRALARAAWKRPFSPSGRALLWDHLPDKDRGRLDTETHHMAEKLDWPRGARCYPGEPRFSGLKAILNREPC